MIKHDYVNATMYNNWTLPPKPYLEFLVEANNIMLFETSNPGHDNLTIGYEEY